MHCTRIVLYFSPYVHGCASDGDHNAGCRANAIRHDRVTWYDLVSMRGQVKDDIRRVYILCICAGSVY